MTLAARIVSEVASEMGLVPLAWLTMLHVRGARRDVALWWLAAAFGVSWLADTAALGVNPWIVSLVYPISQVAIIGAVFLSRADEVLFLVILVAAGFGAVALNQTPDLLLHTVAWLSVVGIVADRWALGRLRTALVVYFGVGWLCWLGYVLVPGWTTWGALQSTRLAGLVLFCAATLTTQPDLRVSSGRRTRVA